MRLTNERKLCAGVMAMALSALAVDRLFFAGAVGGPASAYAVEPSGGESDSSAGDGAPPPDIITNRSRAGAGSPIPVARQFAVIQQHAANTLDGFSVPARWQEAIEREQRLTQVVKPMAEPVELVDAIADNWKSARKFTSIVRYGGVVKALVSGRPYIVGDVLDGFTLVEMSEADGRATFADLGREVTVVLELPRPDKYQQ